MTRKPAAVFVLAMACGKAEPDAPAGTAGTSESGSSGSPQPGTGSSTGDPPGTSSEAPASTSGASAETISESASTSESESESGAPDRCPWDDTPIGWASLEGGTTGGAAGKTVMVDSAATLIEAAGAGDPRVILIQNTITLATPLRIASNKTLRGTWGGGRIIGELDIHGSPEAFVDNVIVQNLAIDGNAGMNDTIHVEYAHHLWFDHLEISNGADGNLDLTHGVDFVTVSWVRFAYDDPPNPDHRFASLVGHSDDNAVEDRGHLRITYHHDRWTDGVVERSPRVRFGRVHVFNNLYDSGDANYGVRAGREASLVVEANYFDAIPNPHEIEGAGAELVAADNVYVETSGNQDTNGSAFAPPYPYTADPAVALPELLAACAGPR